MGMWIIHCDETASWLPLSSPAVAGSECGGVVLAWLISENTSPRRGLAEGVFLCCFCVFFFKCDWGMQVLILMDCMIVVFRLSDCNAPLHAETLEFGRKSGALQYIPQWIWAIVWEKSVASAVISFIHYYETSRLQQWSRQPSTERARSVSQREETHVASLVVDTSGANWLVLGKRARQLQEITSLLVGFL